MDTQDFSKAQGHWILAKMGKKVLRPGGKELTQKLILALNISTQDNIAEFAPGLGFTANLALAKQPRSYVGIDADEEAIGLLKTKIKGKHIQFVFGNAAHAPLENNSKDKVYGEAMLTMQADHRKSEIIKEAHRVLKKGGLYGIHELGLTGVDENLKNEIQKDLAQTIKVNARPLTQDEWKALLEKEGFTVKNIFSNEMLLLEPQRVVADEGFLRSLKISFNILVNSKARKRILEMRKIFRKHQQHMNAVAIIAEKN
ncbi:MAG: SAM-dependent methyltransferase [Cytophagales bacterium]|jgi:SAM-dependent methyltransferase|nr:methyltransferase domain-containing protein [Bacteroidota bacterium]MBS1982080.1 methyltransferase domain-containing protein [Bacteroidota bacterium]WHZ06448.1 MAG: SAM-dependent methyltransferase [Cytophagales bacterium]